MLLVALASAVIGYPSDYPRTALRFDIVSMGHIVRLEPMDVAAVPGQGDEQKG
jgi:hypothetical protein